jgi:beta-lactamase class D
MGLVSRAFWRAGGLLVVVVLLLTSLVGCSSAPATRSVDLTKDLGGIDATFVVADLSTNVMRVHDPARAATRFTPASTFKIPNSMIALETGVLANADSVIAWDPARDPVPEDMSDAWKGDQTLKSAFRHSVVWFYREVARRIGPERMQAWLDRLEYGNRSIGGGVDVFWLRGDLKISANEQVAFLTRFVEGTLPISATTSATLREIMLIEEGSGYRLYGKTGTSAPPGEMQLGWLVGFVETDSPRSTHVFAFNMSDPRVWEDYPRERRIAIVKSLLQELGVLPAGAVTARD